MRPQFSGLIVIGTKGRFWKLGRLIARKIRSTEMTGRYSPRSICTWLSQIRKSDTYLEFLISVLFISLLLCGFFFHFPWRRSVIATETSGTNYCKYYLSTTSVTKFEFSNIYFKCTHLVTNPVLIRKLFYRIENKSNAPVKRCLPKITDHHRADYTDWKLPIIRFVLGNRVCRLPSELKCGW